MMEESKSLADDAVFHVAGKVVVRRIGGASLLVPVSGHAAGGRVFPVNETALLIWESLAGGDAVARIADRLVEQYAIGQDEAHADVRACILCFLKDGLIEEARGCE